MERAQSQQQRGRFTGQSDRSRQQGRSSQHRRTMAAWHLPVRIDWLPLCRAHGKPNMRPGPVMPVRQYGKAPALEGRSRGGAVWNHPHASKEEMARALQPIRDREPHPRGSRASSRFRSGLCSEKPFQTGIGIKVGPWHAWQMAHL